MKSSIDELAEERARSQRRHDELVRTERQLAEVTAERDRFALELARIHSQKQTVNIHRIEIASDDPETFRFSKKELDEATARLRRRAGEIANGDTAEPRPKRTFVLSDRDTQQILDYFAGHVPLPCLGLVVRGEVGGPLQIHIEKVTQ